MFEYSILLGASAVLTIILNRKLKCKYYDDGLTIEMVVEVTRNVSQYSVYNLSIVTGKRFMEHAIL